MVLLEKAETEHSKWIWTRRSMHRHSPCDSYWTIWCIDNQQYSTISKSLLLLLILIWWHVKIGPHYLFCNATKEKLQPVASHVSPFHDSYWCIDAIRFMGKMFVSALVHTWQRNNPKRVILYIKKAKKIQPYNREKSMWWYFIFPLFLLFYQLNHLFFS